MIKSDNYTSKNGKELRTDALCLASLFNGGFSIDWIIELTGLKASEILWSFDRAVKRSILKKKTPDVFYFTNSIKQKSLSALIPEAEKAHLHQRILDLFSRQETDDLEKLGAMAHYLLETSKDLAGCRALIKTGDMLYQAFRHKAAFKCYKNAIQHLKSLKGDDADLLFVNAVFNYCGMFIGDNYPEWLKSTVEEALIRADSPETVPLRPLLKMFMAAFELFYDRYESGTRLYDEGCASLEKEGNMAVLEQALTFKVAFLYFQGRFGDLVELNDKERPEIFKYPRNQNTLRITSMLGIGYVVTGQVTQGIGLLSGLHDQCQKRGDARSMTDAAIFLAFGFLEIGHFNKAAEIVEELLFTRRRSLTVFAQILALVILVQAYGEKGEIKEAVKTLKKVMDITGSYDVPFTRWVKCLIPIVFFMEEEQLAGTGISLENIINDGINGKNPFDKGIAYFFKALLLQKRKGHPKNIVQVLLIAVKWIKKSGHVIQLARIRIVLARVYRMMGEDEKARHAAREAYTVLNAINPKQIPEDILSLIEGEKTRPNLLDTILKLGQEIVAIRDHRKLVINILSAINQITGAERGAIFLVKGDPEDPELELKAARVLTVEDINQDLFKPSMALIRKTVTTGKGRIMHEEAPHDGIILPGEKAETIRSGFCIPMVLKNRIIGALYHDNRIMNNTVAESDLATLSYFAGQAAIALDNARAYEEISRLNQQLLEEKSFYLEQRLQSSQFEDFVGTSKAIQQTLAQIKQVAAEDATVMILGETGVGKELVTKIIHRMSKRNGGPFISVDCSAFSETLITSELFGHEKGAFTGALKQHTGRFELANGGTLFLDEIGNIPMSVQNSLLRVLETRQFERVGGVKTIRSDFRLLTATNENLEKAVKTGKFREDLYYRLNVFPITVPPLRERKEDIPLLARYFLKIHATRMGKPLKKISRSVMDKLVDYKWPGNVRELENVIERGVILSSGSSFKIPELSTERPAKNRLDEDLSLDELERRHILRVLEKTGGRISGKKGAAALLGIHPSTLRSRMKKLGIKRIPKSYA